jgi:type IV pilus assembly protein PilB
MGVLKEREIASALEMQLKIKAVSLEKLNIPSDAVNAVKAETAEKYDIMPIAVDERSITIATMDPTDLNALDTIGFALGRRVKPVLAFESDIRWAINKYYHGIDAPRPIMEGVSPWDEKEGPIFVGREGEDMDLADVLIHSSQHEKEAPSDLQIKLDALVELLHERGIIDPVDLFRKMHRLRQD